MFGYIHIHRPELKIREYDRYRAYYCGTCRDLKEHYGLRGQMTLSYDLTFLGLLLSALYEPREQRAVTRCLVHPLSAHRMLRNEYTAYAAAMNIQLSYQKAVDDVLDEASLRGRAMAVISKSNYRKIVNLYPRKAKTCARCLKEIRAIEKANDPDIDKAAGCFGTLFGTIFVYREDDIFATHLYRLGFFLGKYIYLLDAYDDIEKDLSSGNYNPLISIWNSDHEHFDERCEALLRMMIAEAASAFEALPVLRDAELIRNILYAGVWGTFYMRRKKRQEENRPGKEKV